MKIEEWILPLGILAIGGYFVYNYFKNSAAGQVIGGVVSGVGTVADTAGQIVEGVTSPIVPTKTPMGITSPTPLEMSMPILALPKFIDNFVLDNKGKINPMVAPIKAVGDFALTVGLTTPTAGSTALKPAEVKQAITQMDKSYATIPKAKINTKATTKTAALITNVLTSKTVTMNKVAPQVQIQAYNVAPKVVKVGNAFKKVM